MKKSILCATAILLSSFFMITADAEIYNGVDIPEGPASFVDAVVSYVQGANVGPEYADPDNILGVPDAVDINEDPPKLVSLGDNGEIVVEFTDNALTTSGNDDNDLWFFEVGQIEPANIEISVDGVTWVDVGSVAGSTSGLDIDAYVGSGVVLWELYSYVKIIDTGAGQTTFPFAGADIDAVAAISSNPPPPDNIPPSANAGLDQTVEAGDTVTLDGSSSDDEDGTIDTYKWSQSDGTSVTLSDTSAIQPTFTAPAANAPEALVFRLRVTDNDNENDTDTCIVNVIPLGGDQKAPVANASPVEQTVMENVAVTISGINSVDSDGSIVSYKWEQISGTSVTIGGASSANAAFTAPDVGASGESLKFELTVTDDDGLKGTASCVVNVTDANTPPEADAGDDQTVVKNTLVTLDGTGSTDADTGDSISYMWSQISGPAVTLSDPASSQPTFTAPDTNTGIALEFELTVTDNGGLTGSDTCFVNVITASGANTAPTADAGANQTVEEGDTVTLDATGSTDTEDNTVDEFLWKQLAGPNVRLSDPASSQPTFTAPSIDEDVVMEFEVTVTDSGGLKGADSTAVTVTVSSPGTGSTSSSGSCFIAVLKNKSTH